MGSQYLMGNGNFKDWTSHGFVDTGYPHNEACSNATGLTSPI